MLLLPLSFLTIHMKQMTIGIALLLAAAAYADEPEKLCSAPASSTANISATIVETVDNCPWQIPPGEAKKSFNTIALADTVANKASCRLTVCYE